MSPQKRFGFKTWFFALVWRTTRMLLLLAVLHGLAFAWIAKNVKADVETMMLGAGAQMMRYAQALHQDQPRTISINGQSLQMSVGSSANPITKVLEDFHNKCKWREGSTRLNLGGQGFVACLETGVGAIHESPTPRDWAERIKRFIESGNLSEVGLLRYVYAKRDHKNTTFVTLWTDSSLNVWEMFPRTGDVPGRDIPGIARPQGARRLLSASESGFDQSITIYGGTQLAVTDLHTFYQKQFERAGWKIYPATPPGGWGRLGAIHESPLPSPTGGGVLDNASTVFVAERNNQMVQVVTGTDAQGLGHATFLNLHGENKHE